MVFASTSPSLPSSTPDISPATTDMVLPRQVESVNVTQDFGRFVISPLERGYGLTLGNALRRVLLSSLPGAAVTSIRVSDVLHEFSEIPHVREDMTQLILQVKQLRLVLHDVDNARLLLQHRGAEGIVTAADLLAPSDVEVVNPSLYLFTVDDPDAELEMEFHVSAGRGYSPAEERGRLSMVTGLLPVDAVFSPIRRVNFTVEDARVGQRTNYDRLTLELLTDGTIRPEEALAQAAKIMVHHLKVIAGVDEDWFQELELPAPVEEEPVNERLYDNPIEELDLSVRVFNSLKRTGITSVGEVLDMLNRGTDAMLAIRNFGEKSLDELKAKLQEKNYLPFEEDE